ncbi:GNAT family N-acetyltransferase [Anaerosinus gibii]|uniref:GNAT family N-acetyltransferase n=1 Tax=Selenobaculum gibii TaxID=3054208 RepID=A0A9Y2ER20_9FIRM|nr:GNAT family N-acetyltransferase [Selenobaculum gbiensis]WIW70667.1 GNAT family N-acetyltransferase [Selenobaculum gbiensis]
MQYLIEKMTENHWERVKKIYLQGIHSNLATFQTDAPEWETWNSGHTIACRFVAIVQGEVEGWVAISPASSRCCYQGVGEVSLYIDEVFRGKGMGAFLLNYLVLESEKQGFWSLYSAIIKENEASIFLHEKCGFKKIGIREKLAKMKSTGKWHDVVLMERRSTVIGIK